MVNKMKTKDVVIIALCAAILSVLAPLSIPLAGKVPISLATFVVMLIGLLLGPNKGLLVVLVYIILAFIGLPIMSGFTGGAAKLLGATGGYVFGYLPLIYLTGLFGYKKSIGNKVLGMLIGTIVLYAFGTAWFVYYTKMDLKAALLACVVPFLIGDALKMVACILLEGKLSKLFEKYYNWLFLFVNKII